MRDGALWSKTKGHVEKSLGIIVLLLTFLCSCAEQESPSGAQIPENARDTLEFMVTDGVFLRLDGLENSYGLGDTAIGVLTLYNLGNPQPLPLHTYNVPQYGWFVNHVEVVKQGYYWPSLISPAEWRDTLEIGDTLSFPFKWHIITSYPDNLPWYHLEAFSGSYRLRVGLGGHPLLQNMVLTKYIYIAETGDPLSAVLYPRGNRDSINVDFVVRNRISREVRLEINGDAPLKMYFVDNPDTLLVQTYTLPSSFLFLPPHSDTIIFRLRAAKSDPLFESVRGRGWYLWLVLHLRDREVAPQGAFMFTP